MLRSWLLLTLLFAMLCAVTAVWVSIDRRPPEWDHANHLERAFDCYRILSEPGHGRLKEIIEASSFYPPLAPCAAGLLYFVFPIVALTAQSVMLAYLAVALIAVFALGARLWDPAAGLLAAFFLGTAPFVVYSLTNFQLDLPLMAMVAVALYVLVRTEHFYRLDWSIGFGVAIGLGMLTKPPFTAYVLPPLLWAVWHALRAPDRRRRLSLLGLALLLAGVLALPWYGPRLLGLPMQIANRSFKQAAESGHAEAFTSTALLFYPRVFVPQFGALTGICFAWGVIVLWRDRAARAVLWLAALVPFLMFLLIQNKNLRYTLPILPAAALVAAAGVRSLGPAWRRAAMTACVACGLLQVSMAAFGLPSPPRVPGFLLPLVISEPPSPGDWQQDRVLDDVVRASTGRPAIVAVVPNYNFFSVSNFRYEAARRWLPLQITRAWSDAPLGVDFIILKTGSQGPAFSVEKPDRIMQAFDGGDPYLARAFPVIREYPLPDGSVGILRMRHIPALERVPAALVARRLEASPERLLAREVREAVGLRARVNYRPEALVRGEAERIIVAARSALVGEFSRRESAPLRIRDVEVEVEGLVFNPQRLMEAGDLEILDVKTLRIRRLTVTEADLRDFLARQRRATGISIYLGEGVADVAIMRLGPPITARLRLARGTRDTPLILAVDRLAVAGVPIPSLLVDWIARHFDPTPALRRLPLEVVLGSVRVLPGRIEIAE